MRTAIRSSASITNLNPGDRILIERDGRIFTYAVEGLKIVKANDLSVAAPTGDNRLTLITCDPAYYPGPAPQRLVVISKLVSQLPAQRRGIEVFTSEYPVEAAR